MSDPQPSHGPRPLIWIVDDSPTEALIAERSLGSGYDFERFTDGSVVVERLAAGAAQPDLVLLDWVMPGMAGDEVCRFLRTHPGTLELPIILITASRIETSSISQGFASGATDYVSRPFATEELRARVDSAIRAKQLADVAKHERRRLSMVNRLARALFEAGTNVDQILEELATSLTGICDGCSILLLPGSMKVAQVTRHNAESSGAMLAAIGTLTDPTIHRFDSSRQARETLPPAYTPYIDRFGLRGLAILALPQRDPLRGVVTVTRDGGSTPFDDTDIATIGTCIEYTSLAVESVSRFEAERVGRAQTNAILTNLPLGVIVTDAGGALTLVNPAANALIPGIELSRRLGDVYKLAAWATRDGTHITEADWSLSIIDTAQSQMLIQLPGDDTPEIAVVVSSVPLRDGHACLVGSVIAIHDVSAEHAISAERERTAQYQQQMLGIVGHDLRSPLGAILMGTELLEMHTEDNPSAASVLKRIKSSGSRMSLMVDQLLDVTRARLGDGIPVEPREVRLLPLIKSAMEELSLAHSKSRFELVATADVMGLWDPERFGQVVSNLMSNAIHYGKEGAPITISVTSSQVAATMTVHNDNRDKPIAPDVLATLFDPFRRGRNDHNNSKGLGLGLYIVHEIVRAHGGTMDVESTLSGTTFRVVLPKSGPPRLMIYEVEAMD
ncbi:MAG: hybrid sensor histidine kinase/response regulator [Deltaproteobacteria bacterium]|nr:hybrid sensor histidine kinase/response regulator [Deltaproteobacteria bacterium]